MTPSNLPSQGLLHHLISSPGVFWWTMFDESMLASHSSAISLHWISFYFSYQNCSIQHTTRCFTSSVTSFAAGNELPSPGSSTSLNIRDAKASRRQDLISIFLKCWDKYLTHSADEATTWSSFCPLAPNWFWSRQDHSWPKFQDSFSEKCRS